MYKNESTHKNILLLLGITIIGSMIAGCAEVPNDIDAFLRPDEVNTTSEAYLLQPPDEVTIYCAKVSEIHQQVQQIRPDGKISFSKIGEIYVAGKTCAQVSQELEEKVKKLYSLTGEKSVDIRVTKFNSQFYYILGEVNRGGPVAYTGRDTVINAVAMSRPAVTAWKSRIKVLRPSAGSAIEPGSSIVIVDPKSFEFDLVEAIKTGDSSRNVLLQEGDIVYVPPTPLAAVANVLAEFLRPIGQALSPVMQYYQIDRLATGGGY